MKKIMTILLLIIVVFSMTLQTEARGNVLTSDSVSWAFGNDASALFDDKGKLEVFGKNSYGSLGTGDTVDVESPFDLANAIGFNADEYAVSVALGTANTLVVTSEGRVFSVGNNFDGQLGDGTNDNSFTPLEITAQFSANLQTGSKIVQVAVGNFFSMALGANGEVFTWGGGSDGRLGLGDTNNYNTPQLNVYLTDTGVDALLNASERVVQIVAGEATAAFVTSEGRLFVAGPTGYYPFFGSDATYNSSTPVDITNLFSLGATEKIIKAEQTTYQMMVLTDAGRVFVTGHGGLATGVTENKNLPYDLSADLSKTFSDIALGAENSYLLAQDGTLYAIGFNNNNQLGLGPDASADRVITPVVHNNLDMLNEGETIVNVYAGTVHGGFATSEGRYFIWGQNRNGQLGTAKTTTTYDSPTLYYAKPPGYTLTVLGFNDVELYNQLFQENDDLSAVTLPVAPDVPGYVFVNYDGSIPQTMPAENITIKANYSINQYTITFESNGGTAVAPETIDFETDITVPADPTREGYTFDGWYTDDQVFLESFTFGTMPLGGITVYAKWVVNSYTLNVVEPVSENGLTELNEGETVVKAEYSTLAGFILTSENRFFVTGWQDYFGFATDNLSYPFGVNEMGFAKQPTLINGDELNEGEYIVDFAAMPAGGIVLTSEQRILVFGDNIYHRLGLPITTQDLMPPTDITSSITSLLDAGDMLISVHYSYDLTYIKTSNGKTIAFGFSSSDYIYGIYRYFNVITPGIAPYDITSLIEGGGSLVYGNFTNGYAIYQTEDQFIYSFQTELPIPLLNPLPDETIQSIYANDTRDEYFTVLTSSNRLVRMTYEFVTGPGWGFTEYDSIDVLSDVLLDGETIISGMDSVSTYDLYLLTSNSRVLIVENLEISATEAPKVTVLNTPALLENESIVSLSVSLGDNLIYITSLGRAFGYGRNDVIGGGDYAITDNLNKPEAPVELFVMTSLTQSKSYDFGETLDLPPLEDDGNFVFVGYFLDPDGQIPFDATTMPAQNVTVYPYFSELSTYDMSQVVWDYDGAVTYNGTEWTITLDESTLPEGVTVASYSENKATNAGTYYASVTFNYNTETHQMPVVSTLEWTINKADYDMSAVTWSEPEALTYTGDPFTVTLLNLPEGVTANYVGNTFTNVGSYLIDFNFNYDTTNYNMPEYPIDARWEVGKATFDMSGVTWSEPETVPYTGSAYEVTMLNLPEGLTVSYDDNVFTDAGVYTFDYSWTFDQANYNVPVFPDTYTVTVTKATYDMSGVTWNYTGPFTFDGTPFTVLLDETSLPSGVTSAEYIQNTYTNVGTYTAKVGFNITDTNYEVPDILELEWEIKPIILDVSNIEWVYEGPFTYNGTPFSVVINDESLPANTTIDSYLNNEFTNAGDYTATVILTVTDSNYQIIDDVTFDWSIGKATYAFDGVSWNYATPFTYDGTQKEVRVIGDLPNGLTISAYDQHQATQAGTYEATVTFNYDANNYDAPVFDTLTWTIDKAVIDVSELTWVDASAYIYDGTLKQMYLINIPELITISYMDNEYFDAGEYVTYAEFEYDTLNYTAALNEGHASTLWTIQKGTIDVSGVTWTYVEPFVYSGSPFTVTVTNIPQEIAVTYNNNTQTQPGTYEASVNLFYDEDNYNAVTIPSVSWVILPTYTVTFEADGNVLFTLTALEGTPYTKPSDPTKEGYVFKGWNQDVLDALEAEDITYVATWLEVTNDDVDPLEVLEALDLDNYQDADVTVEVVIETLLENEADVSDYVTFRNNVQAFDLSVLIKRGSETTEATTLNQLITITFIKDFESDDEDFLNGIIVTDEAGNELEYTYDEVTNTFTVTTSSLGMIYVFTPNPLPWVLIISISTIALLVLFFVFRRKGGSGTPAPVWWWLIFGKRRKDDEEDEEEMKQPTIKFKK